MLMLQTPAEHPTETKENAKLDWVMTSCRKKMKTARWTTAMVFLFCECSPRVVVFEHARFRITLFSPYLIEIYIKIT